MKRAEKEALATQLQGVFQNTQAGVLLNCQGLDVAAMTELRGELRQIGWNVRVLQNRIARLSLQGTPFEVLTSALRGPCTLVHGEEPIQAAKVLLRFLKKHEKTEYLTGLIINATSQTTVDAERLNALSNLHSREVLLAQLLGLLQEPVTRLARTLQAVPVNLVRTLTALQQQREA